jgi:hypothetical protein
MMSCVNRNCNRPLAHFSEGRLFHFEILSISVTAEDDKKRDFDEVPHREGVHFWLCDSCATAMTLVLEPVGGLRLVPLDRTLHNSDGPVREQAQVLLGAVHQG